MRSMIRGVALGIAAALGLSWGVAACGERQKVTWREDLVLHDGSTMSVTRSMTVGGGRREPGAHMAGERDYTLDFVTPDGRQVHWEDPGHQSLMLLDFLNGIPYLVTYPSMSMDYRNYGCPFPAYLFYRYVGTWQRVTFSEFPAEFRTATFSPSTKERNRLLSRGYITAQETYSLLHQTGIGHEYKEVDAALHSPFPCPVQQGKN